MQPEKIAELNLKLDALEKWQNENPSYSIVIKSGVYLSDVKVFHSTMKVLLSYPKAKLNYTYYQHIHDAYNAMKSNQVILTENIEEINAFSTKKIHTLALPPEPIIEPVLKVVRNEVIDNVEDKTKDTMNIQVSHTDNSEQNQKNISTKKKDLKPNNPIEKTEESGSQLNLF